MRGSAISILLLGLSTLVGCAGGGGASGGSGGVAVSPADRVRAGELLREAGQLDAALQQFNRALSDNPRSVDAVLGIGSVEHARLQYERARDTYRRAAGMDATRFEPRYYLGLMQQVLGETGEAIDEYRVALRLNPDDPATHRDLATAYLQVGRPDFALPHAERAVELTPGSQAAWCNLAATYSLLGRYEDALRGYRTATEIGELDAPVLLGLGDTHLKLENFPRAVNTLAELVRRFPGSVAHERLGYALFRTYAFERAQWHYRRALAYNPEEVTALNGLGATLITEYMRQENRRRKAKLDEALDAWRRSLRMQPDQPRIADLLSRYGRFE